MVIFPDFFLAYIHKRIIGSQVLQGPTTIYIFLYLNHNTLINKHLIDDSFDLAFNALTKMSQVGQKRWTNRGRVKSPN